MWEDCLNQSHLGFLHSYYPSLIREVIYYQAFKIQGRGIVNHDSSAFLYINIGYVIEIAELSENC